MKNRNPAVECYRVLLMFLIVLFHSWRHGIFGIDPGAMHLTAWWTVLIHAMIIWHVDGFVAISGWFGIRLSVRSFLRVYLPILFYSIGGLALSVATGAQMTGKLVTGGWFGGSYLMLLLFAPMLNAAVEHLAAAGKRALVMAWLPLAAGMMIAVTPLQLITAVEPVGVFATSFFMLVFMYLTARVARLVFDQPVGRRWLLACVAVYPIIVLSLGGMLCLLHVVTHKPVDASMFNVYCNYAMPHIWIMALVMLMLFAWYVKLPIWLGRCVAFIAPSMFGVYLIHDVIPMGRKLYLVPEQWLFAHGVHPFLCILISAAVTFFICVSIDLLRRGLFAVVVGLSSMFRVRSSKFKV